MDSSGYFKGLIVMELKNVFLCQKILKYPTKSLTLHILYDKLPKVA